MYRVIVKHRLQDCLRVTGHFQTKRMAEQYISQCFKNNRFSPSMRTVEWMRPEKVKC